MTNPSENDGETNQHNKREGNEPQRTGPRCVGRCGTTARDPDAVRHQNVVMSLPCRYRALVQMRPVGLPDSLTTNRPTHQRIRAVEEERCEGQREYRCRH